MTALNGTLNHFLDSHFEAANRHSDPGQLTNDESVAIAVLSGCRFHIDPESGQITTEPVAIDRKGNCWIVITRK